MTNYNADFISENDLQSMPFASLGKGVQIDTSVKLIGIENISIGNHVRIDAGTVIIASGAVKLGNYVHIAANCYLEGRAGIQLCDFAGLSSYVSLHSVSDDFSGRSLTNPTVPAEYKKLKEGPIVLERHALIGAKATILPGVVIHEGGVLGAHSLARKSVAAWTICAGSPAIFVTNRKRDLLDLEQQLLAQRRDEAAL